MGLCFNKVKTHLSASECHHLRVTHPSLQSRETHLLSFWTFCPYQNPQLHLANTHTHTHGFTPIHLFFQCINEEGFRLFLKTYLEVEDFPVDLCQRLFCSFQNPEAAQGDAASKLIHSVVPQPADSELLRLQPLISSRLPGLSGLHSSLSTCLERPVPADMLTSVSPVEEVFLKDVSCYFSLLEDGQPRDKLECECLLCLNGSVSDVFLQHFPLCPSLPPQLRSSFTTETATESSTAL